MKITVFYPVFEKNAWLGGTNYFNNLNSIAQRFIPSFTMIGEDVDRIPPAKKRGRLFQYMVRLGILKSITRADVVQSFLKKKSAGNRFCLFTIFPEHFKLIGRAQKIFWIPDFQVYHLPDFFSLEEISQRKETFRQGTEMANVVVLSSYTAKKDFEVFLPGFKNKGRVLQFVKEISESHFQQSPEYVVSKYNLPEKFFYVPNQFWQHKNHLVVLKAMRALKDEGKKVTVVFTGSTADHRASGFYKTVLSTIEELGIGDQVKILGAVPLEDVYQLLRQSVAVINPSLFEGWSTTVEEVKSIGKHIILSDIPVHLEQNPPHGIFFPPNDPDALAGAMKKIWDEQKAGTNKEMEIESREKLPARLQQFANDFQKLVTDLF